MVLKGFKNEQGALLSLDDPIHGSLHLSRAQALALSIKSTVGSGIFAIPFGFRLAGLIAGIIILLVVFMLSYLGGLLLLRSRQRWFPGVRRVTYSDVGNRCFGRNGRLLIDTMTIALQVGTIFAYGIFIIETLSNALPSIKRATLVAVLLFGLIPVLQFRRMESISLLAATADIFAVIGLAICGALLISSTSRASVLTLSVGSGAWIFVGIALFSVEGVCLALPVQSSMASPSQFKQVWLWTMVSVFTLYAAFGTLGYAAFGDATDDIILSNFPSSHLKSATQVIYCFALLLSTAVQAVPVFEILEQREAKSSLASIFMRISLAGTAAMTALLVPGFAVTVSLIGAVFGSVMGFGLPALIILVLEPDLSRPKRAGLYLLFILSISCIALGFASIISV